MRSLFLLFLWASFAAAQIVPDTYIVELTGAPGAAFASKDARRAVSSDRMASINAEQAVVRRALEARQASVIADIRMVANALVVRIPDAAAALLGSIPGVARVYPVVEMHLELDRVQVIHKVADAVQRIGGTERAGAGVKIGIIDTGIDNEHPGFQDSSLPELPGFPKTIRDEDLRFTNRKVIVARRYSSQFGGQFGEAADVEGHGTAVAMTAAGVPHQAPFAFISGVAPKAYIGNYCVANGPGRLLDSSAIIKAFDDAVADGMDIINLSLGSEPVARVADDLLVQAVERASQIGVIVVKSGGNSGPDPNTLTSPGTAPSAVTVAASWGDRTFASGVTLGGGDPFFALAGNGPAPAEPISGEMSDVANVDPDGLLCNPIAADSLQGKIAFILRGTCNFSVKIAHARGAGATAALIYSDAARPDAALMNVENETLPAMMVSHADGLRIKARLRENAGLTATLRFQNMPFRLNSNQIAPFSSRGPTGEDGVKPDISAVGIGVYTAAQKSVPDGSVYDPSGYTEIDGTSFSSPIVAGALALVRSARPGLTPAQYRSLIVNSASVFPAPPSETGTAQAAGAGLLNVDAAIRSTVAAAPVSLSFGAGGGTLDAAREFSLTNLGGTAESYTLTVEARGGSAPVLSTNRVDVSAGSTASVSLRWNASDLPAGELQGYIRVRGARTEVDARIPYWYGVRSDTPKFLTIVRPPETASAGANLRLYVRVTDSAGTSLFSPELKVTPGTGGGQVVSVESMDSVFPGIYQVRLRLGTEPGTHTFRFEAGDISKRLSITVQ